MQGFILKITKAKNEDLIVNILTQKHLYTLYRFYGARHSIINLGYKIDFEIEYSQKAYLPRLRHITHLGFNWLLNNQKVLLWQQFIQRFYEHLKDLYEVDNIYFDILDKSSKIWEKQNPKRVAIESYVKLLEFEGRLHKDFRCFICNEKIEKDLSLARGFLPAHSHCIHSNIYPKKEIEYLFNNKKTLFLDDKIIDNLWNILMEGF
ncbi:recombination protein RecO [Nitrosophilus kaiyonis]|uniref:recombination protein RecO n=1 Tax=Nitrosophilus kaiyonis TaxID=2930200 RepID=UPI00249053F9|nr:recombination protein RecO [Nitrosophilus kaiyonis]